MSDCDEVGTASISTHFDFAAYLLGKPHLKLKVDSADDVIKVTEELYEELSQPRLSQNLQGTFVNKNGELVLDGEEDSDWVYEYTRKCAPGLLVFTRLNVEKA